MSEFHRCGDESKARRGARIDLEEGGRYLGIPQHPSHAAHEPVTINPVSTKSGAVQYLAFEDVSGWYGSKMGAVDLWVLPKPTVSASAR